MDCSRETLDALDDLQAVDFTILNLQRTFDTLPQRQAILKSRQTLEDLRARKVNSAELVAKAQAKVDGVYEEDGRLAEKQAGIEALLKGTATGYRDVEARNKELAAVAKRRETLNHVLGIYDAELTKVKAVDEKIDAAIAQVEATEAHDVATFREQGTDLRQRIAQAKTERENLAPKVDAAILALYDKTAERCGGVALAHLKGKTCSVCRGTIDEARLHQIRREAPLSACPLCRRMLVIDE